VGKARAVSAARAADAKRMMPTSRRSFIEESLWNTGQQG
jgi:hypothetical protein